jgi:transcriptional regulator with XRE-family HTH domain
VGSPKTTKALARLGRDVRAARLRRGMAVSDLAVRASTSASTIARLEKGDPGVSIGAFTSILLALGLVERLAELFDIRNDALGLAITAERAPKRGRSSAATRKPSGKVDSTARASDDEGIDPEGMAF